MNIIKTQTSNIIRAISVVIFSVVNLIFELKYINPTKFPILFGHKGIDAADLYLCYAMIIINFIICMIYLSTAIKTIKSFHTFNKLDIITDKKPNNIVFELIIQLVTVLAGIITNMVVWVFYNPFNDRYLVTVFSLIINFAFMNLIAYNGIEANLRFSTDGYNRFIPKNAGYAIGITITVILTTIMFSAKAFEKKVSFWMSLLIIAVLLVSWFANSRSYPEKSEETKDNWNNTDTDNNYTFN